MHPKCQILLGNFKNIKSNQRKQRVRKQATEKFSVACLHFLFFCCCFKFQRNIEPSLSNKIDILKLK